MSLYTLSDQYRWAQKALDDMESFARTALEKIDQTKITDPLYHYTNVAGIKGIIETNQIWFTHYKHLNDPSEIHFGMNVAIELLDKFEKGSNEQMVSFCKFVKEMLEHETFKDNLDIYIASFSHEPDSLGQWRAYGADGQGYALGFSNQLFQTEKNDTIKPYERDVVLKVKYGRKEAESLFLPQIEKALSLVEDTLREHSSEFTIDFPQKSFFGLMANYLISCAIIPNSLFIKHEAYQYEKETRLIILGEKKDLKPGIKMRTSENMLIPYIPKGYPSIKDQIFKIMVGPAADAATFHGLKAFITHLGLDAEALIKKSNIPYRSQK